ncbi:MAG: hypothetical protein R2792_17270 [Saprospiraceae bacterium]
MEHDHHESDDFIEKIRPYFLAFEKSKRDKGLTQKKLSGFTGLREASISILFRYLRNKTNSLPPGLFKDFLKTLKENTIIEDGYLYLEASEKPIVTHLNYQAANIGKAVCESEGDEVCLINTYLSNELLDDELGSKNVKKLENWLFAHKKRIRILLLVPNGKGMLLRSKTDLDQNGVALSSKIKDQLDSLEK